MSQEPPLSRHVTRRTAIKVLAGTPLAAYAARSTGFEQPVRSPRKRATSTTPISYVIIVMFENHTFDNFFGAFPGANGVASAPAPNPLMADIDHENCHFLTSFHDGRLDGFDSRAVVSYSEADLPILWSYRKSFRAERQLLHFGCLQQYAKSSLHDRRPEWGGH